MKEYVIHSNNKILKEWKEWFLFKNIPIKILNNFNSNIEIAKIISFIESILVNPRFVQYLEQIIVGEIPELKSRRIQAMYKDGAIYVSNFFDDPKIKEEKIARDIIHEIAHSLEDGYGMDLYADSVLEEEFIGKRKRLYDILDKNNLEISRNAFLNNLDYSPKVDNFLYNTVGYPKLTSFIQGLFLSPYCVTSLREYFANGFEEYKCGDEKYLRSMCPILYSKLRLLDELVKDSLNG